MGVGTGGGLAVKKIRGVAVGGTVGVFEGRGVLLGTGVFVAVAGRGVLLGRGVLVVGRGVLVAKGVLVAEFGRVLVALGCAVGVFVVPGCGFVGLVPPGGVGVMVGSGVTDAVGWAVAVFDGVGLGPGVAVWAAAVSVAAITV